MMLCGHFLQFELMKLLLGEERNARHIEGQSSLHGSCLSMELM